MPVAVSMVALTHNWLTSLTDISLVLWIFFMRPKDIPRVQGTFHGSEEFFSGPSAILRV